VSSTRVCTMPSAARSFSSEWPTRYLETGARKWAGSKGRDGLGAYMLNTRSEEKNTVFYSYLACFVNTCTLNMYVSMSYTGLTRRNALFICVRSRHRNT